MTPQPTGETHLAHLSQALDLARLSPPKPTNFRVGCVIVSYGPDGPADGQILSTGYTLELEGNTHAEQNALTRLARQHGVDESRLHELDALSADRNVTLYTTLEPCGLRLSGNKPCVERIIDTRRGRTPGGGGVRKVVFGAKEPGTFVKDSKSLQRLDEEGVPWEYIPGLEEEILKVAMEGHEKKQKQGTNVDDITPEERRRQEALPRNPKKRMMETV